MKEKWMTAVLALGLLSVLTSCTAGDMDRVRRAGEREDWSSWTAPGRYRADSTGRVGGGEDELGRDLTQGARDIVRDAGDTARDVERDIKNMAPDMKRP